MKTRHISLAVIALVSASIGQAQQAPAISLPTDSKLMLVIRNDVANELGLVDSQKLSIQRELDRAKRSIPSGGPGMGGPGGGGQGGPGGGAGGPGGGMADMMRDRMQRLFTELEASVNQYLWPEQRERLAQIQLQQRGVRIAFERNARRQLNVSKEQDKLITQVEREHQQRIQKLMDAMQKSGKRPTGQTSEMRQAIQITEAALTKILTEAQMQQIRIAGGQAFTARPELGNYAELPMPGGPR
jgi:hypothetical protein